MLLLKLLISRHFMLQSRTSTFVRSAHQHSTSRCGALALSSSGVFGLSWPSRDFMNAFSLAFFLITMTCDKCSPKVQPLRDTWAAMLRKQHHTRTHVNVRSLDRQPPCGGSITRRRLARCGCQEAKFGIR